MVGWLSMLIHIHTLNPHQVVACFFSKRRLLGISALVFWSCLSAANGLHYFAVLTNLLLFWLVADLSLLDVTAGF